MAMRRGFPDAILRLIRLLGINQRAFAKQTNVQPSTITKALTGGRPTEMMIQRICNPSVYSDPKMAVDLACVHLKDELLCMGLSEEIVIQPAEVKDSGGKDKKLDYALSTLRNRAHRSPLIREMLIDFNTVTSAISEQELEAMGIDV